MQASTSIWYFIMRCVVKSLTSHYLLTLLLKTEATYARGIDVVFEGTMCASRLLDTYTQRRIHRFSLLKQGRRCRHCQEIMQIIEMTLVYKRCDISLIVLNILKMSTLLFFLCLTILNDSVVPGLLYSSINSLASSSHTCV